MSRNPFQTPTFPTVPEYIAARYRWEVQVERDESHVLLWAEGDEVSGVIGRETMMHHEANDKDTYQRYLAMAAKRLVDKLIQKHERQQWAKEMVTR